MLFEAFPDVRTFRTCFLYVSICGKNTCVFHPFQSSRYKRPERPERPRPSMNLQGKNLGRLKIFTSGNCAKRPGVKAMYLMWKQHI